jgi:beta-1,4-N-acetylglucosaminyltransferase
MRSRSKSKNAKSKKALDDSSVKRPIKHLFVTVGTTKFDELLQSILQDDSFCDILVDLGVSFVTIQCGNSLVSGLGSDRAANLTFKSKGVSFNCYRFKPSIEDDLKKADLVISHAGAGSIFETLRALKPLIVVVNNSLADNHQVELADAMNGRRHCLACTPSTLAATLVESSSFKFVPLMSPDAAIDLCVSRINDLMGTPMKD